MTLNRILCAHSAFHSLNLMNNITYLVGVSGGAWATAVYSYYQHDDVSDATMLGPIVYPEDMTFGNLGDIEDGCVRAFVNSTSQLGGPSYEDYADFIQVPLLYSPLYNLTLKFAVIFDEADLSRPVRS